MENTNKLIIQSIINHTNKNISSTLQIKSLCMLLFDDWDDFLKDKIQLNISHLKKLSNYFEMTIDEIINLQDLDFH